MEREFVLTWVDRTLRLHKYKLSIENGQVILRSFRKPINKGEDAVKEFNKVLKKTEEGKVVYKEGNLHLIKR